MRRRYDNDAAYRQSKQADRMLTVCQAQELADDGITVNVCHLGTSRRRRRATSALAAATVPSRRPLRRCTSRPTRPSRA